MLGGDGNSCSSCYVRALCRFDSDVLLISTWFAIQALRAWNACCAGLWQVDLTHHGDKAQHYEDVLCYKQSLSRLHEGCGSLIKFH